MGRAPCCEKMGLKRGPWTPEEDHLLIAYIQQHGHGNWRALPKFAGLLRCGKSCRLRWTNYLRPDIKRGNFTKEEEDTIINLHQALGNRWSTIAARLPGRTDNEIKNVWHTHLKKKLKSTDHLLTPDTTKPTPLIKCEEANMVRESKPKSKSKFKPKPKGESKAEYKNLFTPQKIENPYYAAPLSPQPSSSDMSSGMESATTDENHKISVKDENHDSWESLPQTDENLWSDVLPMEHFSSIMEELSAISTEADLRFPVSSITSQSSSMDDGIEFWYDLFANSEKLPDLPEF